MRYSSNFFFRMRKAYWIKQATIPSAEAFIHYIKTIVPWLLSTGGRFVARNIKQSSELDHWDGGQLGVIVEFDSVEAAQKAFYSENFQKYIKISGLFSDMTLSIID